MGSSDPKFQRWGTASELGDFAYCRRAWWWKRHPESLPAGADYTPPEAAYAKGLQVHAQMEAAHVGAEASGGIPWGIVALAGGLILLVVVVLWIL